MRVRERLRGVVMLEREIAQLDGTGFFCLWHPLFSPQPIAL
jgi:hypothetical protein